MPCQTTKLIQPGAFEDPLTEVLRKGTRALPAQAIEAEVAEFLDKHRAGCRQAAACPRPWSRCQR